MYWFLLKKALPFTLTFIFGAALSGLTGLFGSSEKKSEWVVGTHTYEYGRSCRTRSRTLVAESKPLAILFKPDARVPRPFEKYRNSMWVRVTFGADGKVQDVEQLQPMMPDVMQQAVERAARQIRFEPEMINSVPISVKKEIEIRFMFD